MFTGLVEETGRVVWLRRSSQSGLQIQIAAPEIAKGSHRGDSIAVNGCCLTVANHRNEFITFDLLQETLDRTNLRHLRPDCAGQPGTPAGCQRPARRAFRARAHRLQRGDSRRTKKRRRLPPRRGAAARIPASGRAERLGRGQRHQPDGGVVQTDRFTVWIIPHTRKATNLHAAKVGDQVNLEFDMLAKYVERMLARSLPTTTPPHFTDRDLSGGRGDLHHGRSTSSRVNRKRFVKRQAELARAD